MHDLYAIRTLFRDHFGQDFETKNVHLLLGNAVNSILTCMINVRASPAQELKLQLLEDIKKEHQLHTVNLYSEQTFMTDINTVHLIYLPLKSELFYSVPVLIILFCRKEGSIITTVRQFNNLNMIQNLQ